MGNIFSFRQKSFSKKIGFFLIVGVFVTLTACGQKGALYLPKSPNQPLIQPSDNGTEAIPTQYINNASIDTQNPNILPSHLPSQDKTDEF